MHVTEENPPVITMIRIFLFLQKILLKDLDSEIGHTHPTGYIGEGIIVYLEFHWQKATTSSVRKCLARMNSYK